LVCAAALSGCGAGGGYKGTERGIDLEIEGALWGMGGGVRGRSTTYKKDVELPLGTLTVTPEGGMDMTGPGVETWARMMFCEAAPHAAECNGL